MGEGSKPLSEAALHDLVIESDSGARKPTGIPAVTLLGLAFLWSLFQLWISSPLPYTDFFSETLGIPVINSTMARYVHLSFAIILAFMAYPATKRSPRRFIPIIDWVFAIIASICVLYLFFFRDEIALRSGIPSQWDIAFSVCGVLMLLEAARRALGPPLVIIASIFLFYTFAGHLSFMPDVIAHKGQSLAKVSSHQWLTTEGVFGIALGVSTDFVFLFVLFGALLERAGAGNYFIKLAFSMLGHFRGGPAKAAVLASAMTGLISGSSIANVVTTGTFTVPLMRRVGFSREKSGAVEVASSVNGQIMPPVMGAAAFLMVEYVGIPYVEVVKAAFIPAVISYIALLYIVHLEALKLNLTGLPKQSRGIFYTLLTIAFTIVSIIILSGIVYYGIGWIKQAFPEQATIIAGVLLVITYLGLLRYSCRYPALEMDNPNSPIEEIPPVGATFKTGLFFILPIVVLIWCLMIERFSPGLSAFWATVFMMVILVTQQPLSVLFRKEGSIKAAIANGFIDLLDGMVTGARNMIGIGIATATAGIIVGAVSLTGVGQVMTELVEIISGGSFFLVLVFTALICLILGMGLPTTANYIVVASLMAKVIEDLGAQNGILVPAIAIHLFVFYFGIMADVTPPVGLASFAAAAVSGGDPIRTGVQAFVYSIRTVILPFIFIYNTDLLLVGVTSFWHAAVIFCIATFAILLFAASTQGYFIVRSKRHESLILLLVAFSLFRPTFFVNLLSAPYEYARASQIEQAIAATPAGKSLKIHVKGEDLFGEPKDFVAHLAVDDSSIEPSVLLENYGLVLSNSNGSVVVDDVVFNSPAEKDGFDFDFVIKELEVPRDQFSKRWIYLGSMLLFSFVLWSQRKRKGMRIAVRERRRERQAEELKNS